MTEHINKQFDQDLEAIRSRMMQMGGLVEAQIRAAISGYLDGDKERIEQVIAGDAKVNELEIA
ncbi:MAG: PhoU domain-containing protein, partial [Usitatibacter sp.]